MNSEPSRPPPRQGPPRHRLFLHDGAWRVGLKIGSDRVFCYMMAPGQDYYHRLLDGEIFVFRGDEQICLDCAMRRGLLSYESRALGGESSIVPELNHIPASSEYDLAVDEGAGQGEGI